MCCMKNGMLCLMLMEGIYGGSIRKMLLNVENDWDGEVDCPEVMGSHCLISEEELGCSSY